MIETIYQWDQELFPWFNSMHTSASDQFFWVITNSKTWIPFYLLLAFFVIRQYGWKNGLILLAGTGAAVGLADYIASGVLKPWLERPRPSHAEELKGLVHLVNGYRGGKYGLVSSHASTTMAVATSLYLYTRKDFKWVTLLFPWAILIAYSRIAIGVHYPGDILGGMLVGVLCSWMIYAPLRRFNF